MELTGCAALVTGGKRIGQSIARHLASRGVHVALSYATSRDEADAAAAEVRAAGTQALVLQADVSDPAACARIVDETARTFGRFDILVHLASVYRERAFDALTLADWQANLDVDLRAAFLCAKAAVPHMRRQGGGRIVAFSDWTAKSGRPRYPGWVPYYVAKTGVIALVEALALELAPDRILVNAIAPGPILPPPGASDEATSAVERVTPLGRWGGSEDVARAVMALLDNDFITGETVRVDGGRHVK